MTYSDQDPPDIHSTYRTYPRTNRSRIITVRSTQHEEEYYSRFLKITEGEHTALVFYEDASDLAWAQQIARGLAESNQVLPLPTAMEAEPPQ